MATLTLLSRIQMFSEQRWSASRKDWEKDEEKGSSEPGPPPLRRTSPCSEPYLHQEQEGPRVTLQWDSPDIYKTAQECSPGGEEIINPAAPPVRNRFSPPGTETGGRE